MKTAVLLLITAASLTLNAQQSPSAKTAATAPKKAKKVWTNDDFGARSDAATSSQSPAVPAGASGSGDSATQKPANNDAAQPAGKPGEPAPEIAAAKKNDLKSKLDSVRAEKEDLQHKLERMQQDVAKADSDFRRRMFQDAVDHAETKLSQLSKEQEQLEQKMQDSPK